MLRVAVENTQLKIEDNHQHENSPYCIKSIFE